MEVKRCEVQRIDAEHEVTRLKTALDHKVADCKHLQVRALDHFHYIMHTMHCITLYTVSSKKESEMFFCNIVYIEIGQF